MPRLEVVCIVLITLEKWGYMLIIVSKHVSGIMEKGICGSDLIARSVYRSTICIFAHHKDLCAEMYIFTLDLFFALTAFNLLSNMWHINHYKIC